MGTEPKRFRELEAAIDGVGRELHRQARDRQPRERRAPQQARRDRGVRAPEACALHGLLQHALAPRRTTSGRRIAEHLYAAHHAARRADRARAHVRPLDGAHRVAAPGGLRRGASSSRSSGDIPELRRLINADVRAAYDGDPAAKNVEEIVFSLPVARGDRRLPHREPALPRGRADDPAHHHRARALRAPASTSTPARRSASASSSITAPASSSARRRVIGNDVKLYQGVTLGALSVPRPRAR